MTEVGVSPGSQCLNLGSLLSLRSVSKSFDQHTEVLSAVDLDITAGEFFSILGPSGCGKSTLLRVIAGLTTAERGEIVLQNIDITNHPPYKRPVNLMFQSYALFPHLTVYENIAFGLRQDKLPRARINERVSAMLDLVRLADFGQRKPQQLSGGQQQRVALARALAKQPKLLMLDEPLAALDKNLREHMRNELVQIQQQTGTTFLMVTHDQEEAMSMSSRLAVMHSGKIRQIGTPQEIYESPVNRQVAEFIGNTNFLYAEVIEIHEDRIKLTNDARTFEIYTTHRFDIKPGDTICIAIRPEKIHISEKPSTGNTNCIPGRIHAVSYLGPISRIEVKLPNNRLFIVKQLNHVQSEAWQVHQHVYVQWQPHGGSVVAE